MSGILDSKLSLRHLLILGVLIAILTVSAGAVAGVRISHGTFTTGSIRMSSASSTTFVNVSSTVTKVIRTGIKVPSGKVADVQATFSATLAHNLGTYAFCFGAFTLDDQAPPDATFKPGQVQLLGGGTATEPDAVTVSMSGYRLTIGPGKHYVNVFINPAYAGCTVEDRALNVLVNVH
jgi:hypothetical protein